jgi:hypothetical protein
VEGRESPVASEGWPWKTLTRLNFADTLAACHAWFRAIVLSFMETHWSRRSSWPQPLFDDCWQIGIGRTVRCTRGQKHQQLENAIGLGSPSVRWKHSLTIVILFAHTEPFGWRAWCAMFANASAANTAALIGMQNRAIMKRTIFEALTLLRSERQRGYCVCCEYRPRG